MEIKHLIEDLQRMEKINPQARVQVEVILEGDFLFRDVDQVRIQGNKVTIEAS